MPFLLQHPQSFDDISGLLAEARPRRVFIRVNDGQVGEAGLRGSGDVGEVSEIREEIAAANRLRFRIPVIISAATISPVIVRIVQGIVHRVLVVLLLLGVIGAASNHPEVARSQKGVVHVFPPDGYRRRLITVPIPLQVSEESVLSPVPLLLGERTPLIGEQVGERGEEVLTLGFQTPLLRIGGLLRVLRFLIRPLGGRGGRRLGFSIFDDFFARVRRTATLGRIRVTFAPTSLLLLLLLLPYPLLSTRLTQQLFNHPRRTKVAEPTGCPGINVDAFVQGVSGWLHLFARGLLLSPVIHNCGENVVEIVGYWIQVRLLNTPIDILFSFRFFFERRKRETDRLFRRIERCIIKVLRLMKVEIHLDTNCKKLVKE